MLATAIALDAKSNKTKLAAARSVLTSKVPSVPNGNLWMPWAPDKSLELIAWLAIDPQGPEATATLDRLLNERNPYGHWRTTWCNGWALIAMAMYASQNPTTTATIALNLETKQGNEALQLTHESPTATRSLPLAPKLQLMVTADHNAFVRVNIASQPPITPRQPVANNGLSIDRIYYRVKADGSTEPLTEAQPGELIRVVLRVTLPKDDTRYLVIEDLLPALLETVNTDFGSQNSALGIRTSENDWNVSHSELRSDRAMFFLNEVHRKGTYSLSYLARCTLAGQATAPPAKVESMYDPENFALSASRIFTVK